MGDAMGGGGGDTQTKNLSQQIRNFRSEQAIREKVDDYFFFFFTVGNKYVITIPPKKIYNAGPI